VSPKLVEALTETAKASEKCSNAMKFVPHPVGSLPEPTVIIKYVAEVYSASRKIKQHEAFDACIKARSADYQEKAVEAREGI